MSIDEFGQFRRKKPARRDSRRRSNIQRGNEIRNNNQSVQEEPIEPLTIRIILTGIIAFFKEKGLRARIQQVLTFILWATYIYVIANIYTADGFFEALAMSILLLIFVSILQLLIITVSHSLEDQVRTRNYGNLILYGLFAFTIIMVASIFYVNNKAENDYSDMRERMQYEETYIGNEVHYCNTNITKVYSSLDDYDSLVENMREGEECTVLASVGNYYKVAREGKATGYVQKTDLTLLYAVVNDSIVMPEMDEIIVTATQTAGGTSKVEVTSPGFEKKLMDNARQNFRGSHILSTEKFTDGQVYQQTTDGSYSGYVDPKGERHGSGAYQWGQDSIYIGNWENGVMTGYGMMYYSKTGEERNGIWKYNDLVTPHRALNDGIKYYQIDSVQKVRVSMIMARIKTIE